MGRMPRYETGMIDGTDEPELDLGILRRSWCLRCLPRPIPEDSRRLPIDDLRIAFREPAMFGAVCFNRRRGVLEVTLA